LIRTFLLAGIASTALAASVAAQPAPALPTPAFITAAAQTDEFERREGQMTDVRASSSQVRDFGQMMIADHTNTTLALKAALHKAGLSIPPGPALSAEQAADIETLRPLHGPAFDRAYVDQQIHVHEAALGVMQAYAAGGDNPVLRKAAADTVPIVQHHLEMARSLAGAP
jgi:putative membrane protein